ncbi:MAG TPA: hypothetical protein VML57_11460, partial [Burkholderiales bacterium]|nr:hypothetical protein [Burkholderiales bacterium]
MKLKLVGVAITAALFAMAGAVHAGGKSGASGSSADTQKTPSAATGASGSAAAGASTKTPNFSEVDKNSDGQISRAEWDKHFKSDAGAGATGSS